MVGTLDEQALTVHRQLPPVQRNLAQPCPANRSIARLLAPLNEHLDGHVGELLGTHAPRPPQTWVVHAECPLDLVGALGEGLHPLALRVAVDRGADADRVGRVAVQTRVQQQVRPAGVRVAAQHPKAVDAHGAGGLDTDRAPDTTGIPIGVQSIPVLEDTREVPLGRLVALRRAVHLDGECVLGAEPCDGRDVERVREEVALGVAEIDAVEPDIGLVEESVEHQPLAIARRGGADLDRTAEQQRAVGVGECRGAAPVPGHRDGFPRRVIELGSDATSP